MKDDFVIGSGRILVRRDLDRAMEFAPKDGQSNLMACGEVLRDTSGGRYAVSSLVFFRRSDSVDVQIDNEALMIVRESDVVGVIKEKG